MAKQTFTTGQVLTAAQMTSLQQTAMGGGSTTDKVASYVLLAADAGTTVIMNSASATTITVNTALFAAGDTVNIQNIGAGICTVTAGTATVNTAGSLALNQYEGGVLYFRSTSASTFFDYVQTGSVSPLTTKGDLYGFSTLDARIPIGTNNQVLTADSAQALGLKWATPTSGGFTLISTTTPTVSTSVVTLSSIPATYQHLLVVTQSLDSTGTTLNSVSVQFNGDTTTAYDSNSTGVNQSSANIFRIVGTSTGGMGGYMNIYNYATSAVTKFFAGQSWSASLDGSTAGGLQNYGTYRSTSAISSITITLLGGETYLATGSVFLYGLS